MKKQERLIKEPQAFSKFIDGIALDKIARDMGIAYQTIRAWKKSYKWIKRKKEIDQALQEKTKQAIINFKKKEIPIVLTLISKTIKDIQAGDNVGNVRDLMMLYDKFKELTDKGEVFPAEIEAEVNKRVSEHMNKFREAIRKGEPIPDAYFPTKEKIGTITIEKPDKKEKPKDDEEEEEIEEEVKEVIYA